MNRKLIYFGSLLTIVSLFFVYACQKESKTAPAAVVEDTPFSATSAEKNAVVVTSTFEALADFAQAGFSSTNLKAATLTLGTCPTINVNYTTIPYSITLDWGSPCTGIDGITRLGKINISMDGMMTVKEKVATMKIENYVVDGKKISGTTKITSAGPNPGNGWPRYDIISEGKIVFADNTFITFHYDGVRLLAEGANTVEIGDDVWRTEIHSANGVNQDGSTWTAKSTKVMVKKGDCKWYNSGTYVVTPSKGSVSTIDFGDGACNNEATLKIGDGEAKGIKLE